MKGVWHFIISCFFFRFWSISGGIVSVSGVSALRTNTQGILSLRWGLFGILSLVFRFGFGLFLMGSFCKDERVFNILKGKKSLDHDA